MIDSLISRSFTPASVFSSSSVVSKRSTSGAAGSPARSQINSASTDFRQLLGAAPFAPAFRAATGSAVGNNGNVVTWNLNPTYFATKETAQWIANKYGTGQVIETPFAGSGGPFSASENEYQIKLADGRLVNAGILAGYYQRNPEDRFPGLADKLIRSQLGLA